MFRKLLNKISRKPLIKRLKKPIIFVHLEKTAGTTFQAYLQSLILQKDLIAGPYFGGEVTNFFGDCSKRLYSGHIAYSDCKKDRIQGYYLTFLRHPLDRCFSLYASWKNPKNLTSEWLQVLKPEEFYAIKTVQEMSFQEYALSEDPWVYGHIHNLMSRRLAVTGKNGMLKLERAYDILKKDFYWFGITEEFDKSIQLLNKLFFGVQKAPLLKSENVSLQYDNTLDEKGRQRLKDLNEYDLILYDKARTLFYQRCQHMLGE